MDTFTDAQAVQLLDALRAYFEAYDENPTTMTVTDLARDLIESLPPDLVTPANAVLTREEAA